MFDMDNLKPLPLIHYKHSHEGMDRRFKNYVSSEHKNLKKILKIEGKIYTDMVIYNVPQDNIHYHQEKLRWIYNIIE